MDRNPTTGIKPRTSSRPSLQRLPFSTTDISAIFNPSAYPDISQGSKYWLPLLALFTGARLNELGQLYKTDIEIGQFPFIRISDQNILDGYPKRLKNFSSNRTIPIHPKLIEYGLLEYVSSRPGVFIFDDLPHNGEYEPTKAYSQHFGRYLRKVGISEYQKVFHSFRHTFKAECRLRGIEEEVHDALTGHRNSSKQVSRSYGGEIPVEVLQSAVSKLYISTQIL